MNRVKELTASRNILLEKFREADSLISSSLSEARYLEDVKGDESVISCLRMRAKEAEEERGKILNDLEELDRLIRKEKLIPVVVNAPSFKPNPVKVFTEFASAVLMVGDSGGGKSVLLRCYLEWKYSGGAKIIDLYDDFSFENCFISLPAPNQVIADYFRAWLRECKFRDDLDFKPKGFPTECFIPYVSSTPKRIPSIFRVYKICFNDLTREEFCILLGKLSPEQSKLVTQAWTECDGGSFEEFVEALLDLIENPRRRIHFRKESRGKVMEICDDTVGVTVLQKVNDLFRLGIIGEKDDPLNINLDAVMRDTKTISCFSMAFVKNRNVRHLIWAWIMKCIWNLRTSSGIMFKPFPELIIAHRELHNNAAGKMRRSSFAYEGQAIFTEVLKSILGEPRVPNIRIVGDTQNIFKMDSDVRSGFTTYLIFHLDRSGLDRLTKMFWLPPEIYIGIQKLKMGQFGLKTRPSADKLNLMGLQYPVMAPPPSSWCMRPEDNFFQVWKASGGEFKEFRFIKPASLISFRKISREESEEAKIRKSTYTELGKLLLPIIERAPGLTPAELKNDRRVKDLKWSETKVYRIVSTLKAQKLIRTEQKGNKTLCFPAGKPRPAKAVD